MSETRPKTEEERLEKAYDLGWSFGTLICRAFGLEVPPKPPRDPKAAPPAEPLSADELKTRIRDAICAAIDPFKPGEIRPDTLAEALFGVAIYVAGATKATGGPARWAAAALLAASGEDVDEAMATVREVYAAMPADDDDEEPAVAQCRPSLRVIRGGKS